MGEDRDIRSKPPCRREDALAVLRRLREAGHVAYFAGGCVRDLLLGLEPKDYDVATDAPPKRVRQLFANTQAVGAAFGVILVKQGGSAVEVATFRSEGAYLDGRHPSEVRFTTPQEDARRRDFTMNGLFLDPLENDRVIDYVGGVEDLRNRVLRAIGNPAERFGEDYLRLLRAVRFAARFDLRLDAATAEAMRQQGPKLVGISPERIGEELRLMLAAPSRNRAWSLLREFHFTDLIFRFVPRRAEPGSGQETAAVFEALEPGQAIDFGLALAAGSVACLGPGMGGSDVRELLTRASAQRINHALRKSLKISNEESDTLEGTLMGAGLLLQDPFPGVAAMKRFLARPTAGLSRQLLGALARVGFHEERVAAVERRLAELEKTDFAPPPLITGDDLTAAGLTPGPAFKRILERVYDAQLEDRVGTRDEAMGMAMGLHESF
jgi:poly(A) polymerase